MRLGEMAHRLEAAIERLAGRGAVAPAEIEPLLGRADLMASAYDELRQAVPAEPVAPSAPAVPAPAEAAAPVAAAAQAAAEPADG